MRVRMIAGAVAFAALILAVGASAKPPGSDAASTVALQWNANAVAAVRTATTTNQLPPNTTSRPLYQTEGLLYMSYVQAAVYDAATKIGHRYVPYHHFSVGGGNASIEAAVEAASLTRGVSRPDLLLVGALLHDIGKGFPGDHTDAGVAVVPDIAARMGVRPADVDVLVALVRNHLLLPDTATRRDLDDPATVRSVADAVSDRTTLDLLHALTVADANATGPNAWGDWKAGLVRDLVGRTAAVIAGEQPPAPDLLDDNQRELAASGELAMSVDGDRVTVTAPDRPGLLWRWAAVLSLHRLEIRAATATSAGPTAVTVFDVSQRPPLRRTVRSACVPAARNAS